MTDDEKYRGKSFDYSYVDSPARIAFYDDLKSAPRITKIGPAKTPDFIEQLATTIYEQSHLGGGKIPYTLIREVSENFIHAQFSEIVVSILDNGNTIRFADQGPGILEKEKAQKPGFSSAIEPMKEYIRGVGSGLPIVKDYLDEKEGYITIEDNLSTGAVVTISLNKPTETTQEKKEPKTIKQANREESSKPLRKLVPIPVLPVRSQRFIELLSTEGPLGITELSRLAECPMSSTHNALIKLEQAGIVAKTAGKKRQLTELGEQIADALR